MASGLQWDGEMEIEGMKKRLESSRAASLLGVLVLGAVASGCVTSGTGQRARDFSLRDLEGRTVRLSDVEPYNRSNRSEWSRRTGVSNGRLLTCRNKQSLV